jgi:hypothetical protein
MVLMRPYEGASRDSRRGRPDETLNPSQCEEGNACKDVPMLMCTGEGASGDSRRGEGGRAHKKPRLVWTAELHARFMNAVNHLVSANSRLVFTTRLSLGLRNSALQNTVKQRARHTCTALQAFDTCSN